MAAVASKSIRSRNYIRQLQFQRVANSFKEWPTAAAAVIVMLIIVK